jgi:alkylresorcinol/alkylpyrone synthase
VRPGLRRVYWLMPYVVAVEPCFPEHYFPQADIGREFLRVFSGRSEASVDKVQRLFTSVGVEGRHLSLPLEAYATLAGFNQRSALWLTHALALGRSAVTRALGRAGLDADSIGLFAFSTVTGVAVPSLEARLMNELGFASQCRRLPLFGLGCVAGAAGVARVADYLRAYPRQAALLLCVELCSLTLQLSDPSVVNVIGSALFGDGAAAVVMLGDEHPLAQHGKLRVLDTRSVFFPGTERTMGWDIRDTGFSLVLSGSVPELARGPFAAAVREFLAEQGQEPADMVRWVAHPGGPAVIDAVEQGLELAKGTLDATRRCLARVGNLSSVSVLILLHELLAEPPPQSGRHGLLFAMGPGFCAELVSIGW